MKLARVDLNNVVAIGHKDNKLGLLIDRGEEIEYLELPAPVDAYFGLQRVESIANKSARSRAVVEERYARPIYDRKRKKLQVEVITRQVYEYDRSDPVKIKDPNPKKFLKGKSKYK